MIKNLLIVESPGKVKTIEEYLAGTNRQRARWGIEHLAQSSFVADGFIYVTTTLTVNVSAAGISGYSSKTL